MTKVHNIGAEQLSTFSQHFKNISGKKKQKNSYWSENFSYLKCWKLQVPDHFQPNDYISNWHFYNFYIVLKNYKPKFKNLSSIISFASAQIWLFYHITCKGSSSSKFVLVHKLFTQSAFTYSLTMIFTPACFCPAVVSSPQSYVTRQTNNVMKSTLTASYRPLQWSRQSSQFGVGVCLSVYASVSLFFLSATTKTKIFVDENKLIFVTKTTTTTKIRPFSSTKRKLKLKFNLLTKTTTKIWLIPSTRRKFQSRISA